MTDRRGVSEAIGFVLVFSLVVSTVGVVYVFGVTDLQQARNAEQVNNVQRAFDLLAENVDELVSRSAPSRGTEIRLQGGTLSTGDPVYINVSGAAVSNSSDTFATGAVGAAPIQYRDDDTTISYAHGAVIRGQSDGSVFVRKPPFVLDGDRFVIPIVATQSTDRAIGGDATVLIRTENDLSDVVVARTEPQDVTVNVTSPRAPLWESYFVERGLICDPSTPTDVASCRADDVGSVYVVVVSVDVAFE